MHVCIHTYMNWLLVTRSCTSFIRVNPRNLIFYSTANVIFHTFKIFCSFIKIKLILCIELHPAILLNLITNSNNLSEHFCV